VRADSGVSGATDDSAVPMARGIDDDGDGDLLSAAANDRSGELNAVIHK